CVFVHPACILLTLPRPPISTLFPYTTLFRSGADRRCRTVTGHHPQRDLRVKELVRTMNETNEQPHTAGAFDIRNFIGVLLAIFGIILVFAGLVGFTPDEARRTGGIDANLWTGIGLIVAAIVFIGWAKVRPLRIDDTQTIEPEGSEETDGTGG